MKSLDIYFGLVSILQYRRSLLTKILNRLRIIGQPDTVILTVEEFLLHYSINPQEQHLTHWDEQFGLFQLFQIDVAL